MLFSYHTHSEFCDGKSTASNMAASAAGHGYRILGFSSHAPLPFDTEWNMRWSDLHSYHRTVAALSEYWEPRGMTILLGLEIDYIKGYASPADPRYRAIPLDYTIGSVHYITGLPGGDFTVDESTGEFENHLLKATGGDAGPVWKEYYQTMTGMIEEGGFDIIGHFDLVKKNNDRNRWFDEDDSHYLAAAFEAIDRAGELDCVAEINTGGIARGKIASTYPSLPLLRRMREAGVRLTIGDDAHAPPHLGTYQKYAVAAATEAGYSSLWWIGRDRQWNEIGLADIG